MKLNKKWVLIAFSVIQVLTIGLLIFGTFGFIRYRHENPPISTHMGKDYNKDNSLGLVAYWKFDKIEKDKTVIDYSGHGNHGKVLSAINMNFPVKTIKHPWRLNYIFGRHKMVKGIRGNAIEIYGRPWISGGNNKAYNTEKFTIAVWVWRERDDDNNTPTIMAKASWPHYDGWWLTTKYGTNFIDMGIAWGEAYQHVESGFELPLKEWHHIAVTMNNADHEVRFFIDGKPFGETHYDVPEWRINWNHDLFIGDYDGSGRWSWYGKIDDARYYDRILNEKEILAICKTTE